MISRLRGEILEIGPTHVVIECGGVGYEANICLSAYTQLQSQKEKTTELYTRLIIREDAHILFAFCHKAEREIFDLLIGVSGVGPSYAMSMISSLDLEDIKNAIVTADVAKLKSVKGIGEKTAQRIIIDLKDKIMSAAKDHETPWDEQNHIKKDALLALEVLGINKAESEKTLSRLMKEKSYENVEVLVKEALKNYK